MKIKLPILPLLVLAGSSCFGLTNDGRKLKEAFRLTNFSGPTNRYAWVCPSNVTISRPLLRALHSLREEDVSRGGRRERGGAGSTERTAPFIYWANLTSTLKKLENSSRFLTGDS